MNSVKAGLQKSRGRYKVQLVVDNRQDEIGNG